MQVRRYELEDFEQVQSWLEARGMKVFHPAILPKTGFIVNHVAAVFVYSTDSDICYLENLISNPNTDNKVRDEAIADLINEAFKEARSQGFKFIMAVTDVPAVIVRALQVGAQVEANKVLLTKQLS